tara:strand:+ start:437 stop:655 length:219 start_codon:yes stop_codon:yes gene_type:complete
MWNNDHAVCVHCDESHDLDADHQCKDGEADLLGTLKSTVEWLQTGKVDGVGFDEQSIIDDIIVTIAKAEGGE